MSSSPAPVTTEDSASAVTTTVASSTVAFVEELTTKTFNNVGTAILTQSTTIAPTLLNLNGYLDNDWKFWVFWLGLVFILFVIIAAAISYCSQVEEERNVAIAVARQSREQLQHERAVNEQLRWHQRFLRRHSTPAEQPRPVPIVISMPHDEDMTRSRLSGEHLTVTPATSAIAVAPKSNCYLRVSRDEEPAKSILKNGASSTSVTFSNVDLNEPSSSASIRLPVADTANVHRNQRTPLLRQQSSAPQSVRVNQNRPNNSFMSYTRDV